MSEIYPFDTAAADSDSSPVISVGSLGGTITMSPSSSGGVSPSLSAADLISSVPGLDKLAQIRATTISKLPGASLAWADVFDAVNWAKSEVEQGSSGVILIQGTDTLEETSYLADLIWDKPEPLVFVGAMRNPSQISPDGPANLYSAALVASSPKCQGLGALVVMDQAIHSASLVYKSSSSSLSAFRSHNGLILGDTYENNVALRSFNRPEINPIDPKDFKPNYVPLWTTWFGDDGQSLSKLLETNPAGVVVAGFGAGHTSFGLAEVISEATNLCPVVLATRIAEGGTFSKTYGFKGSEIDLQNRGAILAGHLSAVKSRILLSLLVGTGASEALIATEFTIRGRLS